MTVREQYDKPLPLAIKSAPNGRLELMGSPYT